MADQDFKINIVTLADLTGIKLTQEQLTALQTAAASGNKEAIADLKKLAQAQKEAERAAKQAQQELTQGIRAAAGYGLIIGGAVAAAINNLANQTNKVTKELAQQGEQLVKNVQEWNQLAQSADTIEQLATAAEKPITAIDALRQKFNEANSETLTLSQTVQDLIEKFATWTPFQPGSNQALLDERIKGIQQTLADAQDNAARNVKRRLDEQRQTHEDIDTVIARESARLSQQQALLRNLDPKTQLQSWVAVEQTIERISKHLESLKAQREKQVKAGEPTTKAGLLGQQEQKLQDLLKSPNLTPAEREAVSQQLTKTHQEKFQQDIADREKAFQKDIADRDKRFTTPPLSTPPAGESTIETNTQLIALLQQLLDLWR